MLCPCPTQNELAELLDEALDDACRTEIESHVEDCAQCQAALESLTGSDFFFSSSQRSKESKSAKETNALEAGLLTPRFVADAVEFLRGESPPARRVAAVLPPTDVGDYRIVRELGRGGMGVVYEAEQRSLGRHVALKILPSYLAQDAASNERFQREARAVASLHHTNIVPIFEVGSSNGIAFYAMQLIEGESLDQVRRNRIRSREQNERSDYHAAAQLACQAADALFYAHQQGIIHRDVKPSNLLLDRSGTVWITDFGLAKTTDSDLTRTGDVVGTLRYISPERFHGQCDERADVYSLGITLYELLTLQPAFEDADRAAMMQKIAHSNPRSPRQVDLQIPKDLETIVLKSIEKELASRYQTADELADDLRRFLRGQPIHARRTPLLKQVAYWARRNRGLAAAVVSIAALLLVLLIGSAVAAVHQSRLRQTAETAKNAADQARIEAEESQSLVEHNLYFSQMNFAGKLLGQAAGTNEIKTMTDAWLPATGLPSNGAKDLRGWEWYFLRTYGLEKVVSLSTPRPSTPLDAVWSPDQTRIATAQSDNNIYLWDSSTGELLKTLRGHPNIVVTVAWNPHKNRLAACDDENNIWVWDLETDQVAERFQAPEGTLVEQVAWDQTGGQLAWSSNSSVFVWNSNQGVEKPVELRGGPGVITSLQWSPDGTHLAGSGWRQRKTVVWDVVNQKIAKDKFDATLVKWSREGHAIEGWLRSTSTGAIEMFQADVKTPVRTFLGHTTMAKFLSWSSDGKWFTSASEDQTARLWDVESGEQIRTFQGHTGGVLTARLNRAGTRVVSTSQDKIARIWSVEMPQKRTIQTIASLEARADLHDRPETSSLSWHPDGKRLAAVGIDGRLRVWDTTTSQLLSQDSRRQVETVCWSPNGEWLAMDELKRPDLAVYSQEETMNEEPGEAILKEVGLGELGLSDLRFSTENRTIRIPHPRRCNGIAWRPDAEKFATICIDRVVRVWSVNSSLLRPEEASYPLKISEHRGHPSRPSDIQWNPKRKDVIATCDDSGMIKIWDVDGERWTLVGHRGVIHQLSWSPNGDYLASAGQDGTVRIWSAESGRQINLLTGHHNAVFSVAWSPLGSRIATGSRDSTVKIWEPLLGREALSLSGHRGAVLSVAWSPDGTRLATADITGAITLWDASRAYNEKITETR